MRAFLLRNEPLVVGAVSMLVQFVLNLGFGLPYVSLGLAAATVGYYVGHLSGQARGHRDLLYRERR